MSNTVSYYQQTGAPAYTLTINGIDVYSNPTLSVITTMQNRLSAIFSDANRDLDFITASYYNGNYVVTCPLVRKNVGAVTYFYDGTSYPEKLYENTIWNDTLTTNQTAIYTASSSGSTPWLDAFDVANAIRYAVKANFNTAKGSSTISRFTLPSNVGSSVASVISSSAILQMYGDPCQGTQSGQTSTCSGRTVQNIASASVANGEVFHPCDMTASMTSTNSWNTTYRNKFVKVTSLTTGKSIVVRITDTSPAGQGVELSYAAYQAIGAPATGSGAVKIELMGN